MTPSRIVYGMLAAFCIAYAGCGKSTDFSDGTVRDILESQAINLDGEQVTISQPQVECGTQTDLWEKPAEFAPGRSRAALGSKARDLKFSDDVLIGEPGLRQPYVQVRGAFWLQVDSVASTKDDGADAKVAVVKVGVKVPNDCFRGPLPMMGVNHGKFTEGAPATFRFKFYDDVWHFDKLIH